MKKYGNNSEQIQVTTFPANQVISGKPTFGSEFNLCLKIKKGYRYTIEFNESAISIREEKEFSEKDIQTHSGIYIEDI